MNGRTAETAVREWAPLAYWIARDFRFPGADHQDVRQEALIALWGALGSYDGRVPLKPHLAVSIRRRLSSKLRDARRQKHQLLNEALRELEVSVASAPERAASSSLSALLEPLTLVQRRAVVGVACGLTYAELGHPKAIDSALYRARRVLAETQP